MSTGKKYRLRIDLSDAKAKDIYQFNGKGYSNQTRIAMSLPPCVVEGVSILFEEIKEQLSLTKEIDLAVRGLVNEILNNPKNKPTDTVKDNGIELLKEDIWCAHKYLDEKLTPRKDSYGKEYSIIGRIKFLEKYCYNPMIIKSDNICPVTFKQCTDECCPVGAVCNLSGEQPSPPEKEPALKDKVDKPNWEIICVKDIRNGEIRDIRTLPFHYDYYTANEGRLIFSIYSLLRTTDGQIVTINDDSPKGKVSRFDITTEKKAYVHYDLGGWDYLHEFIKFAPDNDTFEKNAGPKHLFNEEQYLEIWDMIFSQTGYPPHHPKHPDYMKDRNRSM